MSSESSHDVGHSQSLPDETVNTTVFDEVDYCGSRVCVYGSIDNDVANKQEPSKWIFYYVPLFMPVYQPSIDNPYAWYGSLLNKSLKIRLTQGIAALEEKIRDSLAKKVDESSGAYASSWTIKPLLIDSLTADIVNGVDVVPSIKPCRVDNPDSMDISLNFGFMSFVDEDKANEVVERIRHGDYQIQLSVEYAGFSTTRSFQKVVSFSHESIQAAVWNSLADGPSTSKYILTSQRRLFAKQISNKVEETVFTLIKNKPIELSKRLRSMLNGFIESSLNKAEEVRVGIDELANVWSADDLTLELIENEVNKLFKYDQSKNDKKRDGINYFKLDARESSPSSARDATIDVDVTFAKLQLNDFATGWKYDQSAGENFVSELHDQVKNTNEFSESEIEKMLEKNSVGVEWTSGEKFVAKSIRVIKIADILEDIKASVVAKQIELEEQASVIIKTVNDESIVDSEFGPRLYTTALHHNVKVGVYKKERDVSSNKSFYFVPLMQPDDEHPSVDINNNKNPGWIRAVSSNQINIKLVQYTQQLKEEIKWRVEASSVGDIQPLTIDSLTTRIMDGKCAIEGVESNLVSRPSENILTLQFKVSSEDAQEIVDKILSQEYYIEVSMWLRIPTGPKSSELLSSPIVREVNTTWPPISYESSQYLTRLLEQLKTQISNTHHMLLFSPDSIATGTSRPVIAVLNQQGYLAAEYEHGIQIRIYNLHNNKQPTLTFPTSSAIWDLKSFKDNKLIGACDSGKIKIWKVETGDLVTTLQGHSGKNVNVIVLNKSESLMLSAGHDNNVILWNMVKYQQVRTFSGHTDEVFTVVFNEKNNQVMSGSKDKTIRVWNMMNDDSLVQTLTGHLCAVTKLLLDDKTGLLYSASDDKTIKQWNLETGECLQNLTGHTDSVNDLILNQQGGWLASASRDKSIIIWNKHSGLINNRLHYTDGLCRLALNPLNGGQLIGTTHGGNILFWNEILSGVVAKQV